MDIFNTNQDISRADQNITDNNKSKKTIKSYFNAEK